MSLDNGGAQNLFNHILELWINPEIKRRKEKGIIDEKFALYGAQVILNPKINKTEIRLNKEVKAQLVGVAKRAIKVDESAPLEDMIKEIRNIRLTDHDDPDVGHVTMLQFQGNWNIYFDFRYYKSKIKEIFEAGKEFFDIAKYSLERKKNRTFVDNLYSAIELFAICQIYNMAGSDFQKKRKHKEIQKKYNAFVKIGNFKPEYKDALNNLNELRLSARYVKKSFSLNETQASDLLKIGNDMLRFTEKGFS